MEVNKLYKVTTLCLMLSTVEFKNNGDHREITSPVAAVMPACTSPGPSTGGSGNFRVVAQNQQEEDAFDYVKYREGVKFTGLFGSIAHLVKGALGAGILGGHVAYMKAGVYVSVPLNVIFGIYMAYCLYLLVGSTQILCKRTRIPMLSYSDAGECAVACFHIPKVARFSKCFRYLIDTLICIDLFGSCACYQIIIAKSIKQLVENTQKTSIPGMPGYPELRVYLAAMIIPIVLICLITHLKWLAPFSIAANTIIVLCIGMAVNYAFQLNPTFQKLVPYTEMYHYFELIGMTVFSMSCAGVVIAIENNMREPKKFPIVLTISMSIIILCTFLVSFFGYVAFLDKCETPITVNFPMTVFPKVLKGLIAVMIYVTHGLNFWVPFNIVFSYLKKRHSRRLLMWELIYRAIFVILIALIAIIFPNINALMGFIGTFCLSNMAFIWPNIINLLVVWERPGLGKFKWRLWRSLILIIIGIFILTCGSLVNSMELVSVFINVDTKK